MGDQSPIKILDQIIQMANNHDPFPLIIKMLVIASLTMDGIKKSVLDQLTGLLVESYGLGVLIILERLYKEGFVTQSQSILAISKSQYSSHSSILGLIGNSYTPEKEVMGSYFPYLAYIPKAARLLELVLLGEWHKQEKIDALKIPCLKLGDSLDIVKSCRYFKKNIFETQQTPVEYFIKPRIIFYSIGGITYGEVGALRKVAKECGIELLIVTTCILQSKRFLDMILQV